MAKGIRCDVAGIHRPQTMIHQYLRVQFAQSGGLGASAPGLAQIIAPMGKKLSFLLIFGDVAGGRCRRKDPIPGLTIVQNTASPAAPPQAAQHLPGQRKVECPFLAAFGFRDKEGPVLNIEMLPARFFERIRPHSAEERKQMERAAHRIV